MEIKDDMNFNEKIKFIDDDQDCVIFEVKLTKPKKGGKEASCHVGYKSCFYRKIELKKTGNMPDQSLSK